MDVYRGFGVIAVCLLSLVLGGYAGGEEVVLDAGTWEAVVPLRQELFSVAVGLQIAGVPQADPQDNASLMKCLAEVASPVLRVPGGDSMNTWNWDTGGQDGKDRPGLGVSWWQALARRGGSVPLWGINVSAPPDVTERFARRLRDSGDRGDCFEFGNELYYDRWGIGIEQYLAKAQAHAAILRKYFPHCKLGVPLASYPQWATRKEGRFALREPAELSPWIRALARAGFYDAVVLHLYTTPWDLGFLGKYTKDEVAHWGWTKADRSVVDAVFGLARRVAPGQRVWVTEWAFNASQYLQEGKGYPAERRWQVHQTMLAVLHDARFLLNTAAGDNPVEIMTTWTLVDQPAVALWKQSSGPTIRAALFCLLRRTREGNDGVRRFTAAGAPVWQGPAGTAFAQLAGPAVDVFAFSRGGRRTAVLVLNPLGIPVQIAAHLVPSPAGAQALTGDSLLPGWGEADNPLPKDWAPPYRYENLTVTGAGVTVPPCSLTLIRGTGL